jgi:signal transduction histidine kinase
MTRSWWWNTAVVGTVIAVSAIVVLSDGGEGDAGAVVGAMALMAAFAAFFVTVGRRGLASPRWALVLQLAAMATVVAGTTLSPSVATLQCIAFPMMWSLSYVDSPRRPIVLCTVLAVGTAVAFGIGLGPVSGGFWPAFTQGLIIEAVSLGLGIGIGMWFTIEMRKGDENTRLLAELTAAQDQLAALHRETGAAAERERLARELHDTIAQNLTSLVMLAQRGQNRGVDDEAVRDDLALIEQVAREALTEARALVAATATVPVDGGLAAALERLVATFERETRIRIDTDVSGADALPRDLEVVLLRCAQEALANVRKHAGATRARLTLSPNADGVALTIGDDGVGLGGAVPPQSGFGIEGMRQRLALVGGSLRVATLASGGTELVATVPGRTSPSRSAGDAGDAVTAGGAA